MIGRRAFLRTAGTAALVAPLALLTTAARRPRPVALVRYERGTFRLSNGTKMRMREWFVRMDDGSESPNTLLAQGLDLPVIYDQGAPLK